MPRLENPVIKDAMLGNMVKVQQIIDYIVLMELQKGKQMYVREIDELIASILGGVGVNDSYLSARLKKLYEDEYVNRQAIELDRYNIYYSISKSGDEYLAKLSDEISDRLGIALKALTRLKTYMEKKEKGSL